MKIGVAQLERHRPPPELLGSKGARDILDERPQGAVQDSPIRCVLIERGLAAHRLRLPRDEDGPVVHPTAQLGEVFGGKSQRRPQHRRRGPLEIPDRVDAEGPERRPANKAQSESHADQAHALGTLLRRRDVGDVGLSDGDIGSADTREDSRTKNHPQCGAAGQAAAEGENHVRNGGCRSTGQ